MFLLCKNVKIVLRECSVGQNQRKLGFSDNQIQNILGQCSISAKKTNTTSESKALLTTFRREASLSDLSFGLGWDLRLRILGLMVEWSGEQPSTQFPSGTSVFRMCWPFRSKSSTFRVLEKHGFLLILFICPKFYAHDCPNFLLCPFFCYTTASKKELNVFFWKNWWFSSIWDHENEVLLNFLP